MPGGAIMARTLKLCFVAAFFIALGGVTWSGFGLGHHLVSAAVRIHPALEERAPAVRLARLGDDGVIVGESTAKVRLKDPLESR